MSSSRLLYDSCAYDQKIGESRSSFDYLMYNGKFKNCDYTKCASGKTSQVCDEVNTTNLHGGSRGGNSFQDKLVDVESELRGLNHKNSSCNSKRYNPGDEKECSVGGIPNGCVNRHAEIKYNEVPPSACPTRCSNVKKPSGTGINNSIKNQQC